MSLPAALICKFNRPLDRFRYSRQKPAVRHAVAHAEYLHLTRPDPFQQACGPQRVRAHVTANGELPVEIAPVERLDPVRHELLKRWGNNDGV